VRGRLELATENFGKAAFFGFDDGVGVMGDQPAQQPRRGFHRIGIGAENGARLRARAATPWTCAERRGRDSWRSA
jgi:hypothetical protein